MKDISQDIVFETEESHFYPEYDEYLTLPMEELCNVLIFVEDAIQKTLQ